MKLLPVVVVLMMCACASQPRAAAPGRYYQLVDLSVAYTAWFDRTAGMATEPRVAAFKADMQPRFPGFYEAGRPGGAATEERLDARIARSIADFPAQRAAYTAAASRFSQMLDSALTSFRQSLRDLAPIGEVYLLHSLGEMDGGTRTIGGQSRLVFGADVIARVHRPDSERPFFHHELFHVYQQQWFGECEQLWCSLWVEGTAVLAAAELNPGATDDQLLLTMPEPIRSQVEAHRHEAVCAVRARLESLDEADASALFSFRRLNVRLPPRFGYYVGYLVAAEVRRTHTLREIAHMNAARARVEVDAGLAVLAGSTAGPC